MLSLARSVARNAATEARTSKLVADMTGEDGEGGVWLAVEFKLRHRPDTVDHAAKSLLRLREKIAAPRRSYLAGLVVVTALGPAGLVGLAAVVCVDGDAAPGDGGGAEGAFGTDGAARPQPDRESEAYGVRQIPADACMPVCVQRR